MCINIRTIDENNWEECANLEVEESQKSFIASNLHALAESKFLAGMEVLGIYKGNTMVGFAAYVLDEEGDMNLYKLMVDKKYQGKGYGKEALNKVMDIVKKAAVNKEVWLSIHPKNTAAKNLYLNYGFKVTLTGLEEEDEIFLKYDI